MNIIQREYNKAMQFLESIWSKSSHEEKMNMTMYGINGRWLRNEANMWESYVDSVEYILNGINYDPLHPDNLSAIVIKDFLESKK